MASEKKRFEELRARFLDRINRLEQECSEVWGRAKSGFRKLKDDGRTHLSYEQVVLEPEWTPYFRSRIARSLRGV